MCKLWHGSFVLLYFLAQVLIGLCLLWPVKDSVSEAAYVLGIAETFLSKGFTYLYFLLALISISVCLSVFHYLKIN